MKYLTPILGAAGINLATSFAISQMFEAPAATKEIQGFFDVSLGTQQYLVLFILIVALPIAEEWLFRGFLWKHLNKFISLNKTFFAISILFAFCHIQFPVVIGLLPLSFFLGYLRKIEGNIEASTVAHITHNLVGVLVTLL